MIKLLSLLSIILFLVFPNSHAMAKTGELVPKEQLQSLSFLDYESINPNSLLYQFKRLGEEVKLRLIFNNNKKNIYKNQLFKVRFNELIYIINFQKTGFLAETVNRYNVFVGKTKSDYKNMDSSSQQVKKYIAILEKLRDIYPANSSYWLSIQQAIDSTRNLL